MKKADAKAFYVLCAGMITGGVGLAAAPVHPAALYIARHYPAYRGWPTSAAVIGWLALCFAVEGYLFAAAVDLAAPSRKAARNAVVVFILAAAALGGFAGVSSNHLRRGEIAALPTGCAAAIGALFGRRRTKAAR